MDEITQAGHEQSDFNPGAVLFFAAVLAATIAAAVAVSFLFMRFAAPRVPGPQSGASSAARERAAVAPRLQVQGSNELREMREAEERVLNSYAWLDKEAGIVRIPVERAMELLVDQQGDRRQAVGGSQKQKSKR